MAFHYQNILQEKDLQYEDFHEQYQFILKYTKYRLNHFMDTHTRVTMKQLQNLAVTSIRTKGIFIHENFSFLKDKKKFLL